MSNLDEDTELERRCVEKLRALAERCGEVVSHEQVRYARDVWLQLAHRSSSGDEPSTALCCFQLKGISTDALDEAASPGPRKVTVSLDTRHVRYWYLQPMPTFLVIYIESADDLLVLNIQRYIGQTWGPSILRTDRETVAVDVPRDNVLDQRAFERILVESDRDKWRQALKAETASLSICRHDYNVLWHVATAQARNVRHTVHLYHDTYSDVTEILDGAYLYEYSMPAGDKEVCLTLRWGGDIVNDYPYLDFYNDATDEGRISGAKTRVPKFDKALSNGGRVEAYRWEHFLAVSTEYFLGVGLNDLGRRFFESLTVFQRLGLIALTLGESDTTPRSEMSRCGRSARTRSGASP